MKKCVAVLLAVGMAAALCACGTDAGSPSAPAESSQTISEEVSEEVREETSSPAADTNARVPVPADAVTDTNLSYTNPGKMGDNDGPAVCVYAKPGYFRASLDIAVSDIRMQTLRADGRFVNAYIFLGVDILDAGGSWLNCFDAGLVRSGRNGAWHLFYNVYATPEGESAWYESGVKLSADSDYRLVLDTSKEDEKAILSVYEIGSERLIDSVSFSAADMLCDGSNTAYYQNFALDFPDDLKVGADGKPGVSYDAADWPASVLYSSDEGLYMQNINVTDARLYGPDGETVWNEDVNETLGLWPDKTVSDIDYVCTRVVHDTPYSRFRIDLDMNRAE
ncbi:MAG: hypothetical protein ACI3ZE_08165 [Candidatus Woodwardiibium sp.]